MLNLFGSGCRAPAGHVGPLSKIRIAVFLAILGSTFIGPIAFGKNAEDRDWILVQTDNFRIHSLQKEKDTIELAHHLEMFRVAVQLLTNIRSTESPIPINIYAFKNAADIRKLGYKGDNAGFLVPSLRDYTIVIRNTRGMAETSIILHEYVHFLVRNNGSLSYPQWFDEGFAEYLSSGGMRRGNFEVGRFPEDRRSSFLYTAWIPIEKILSPEGYSDWNHDKKAMFYAEAWALVHYLLTRADRKTSFSADMAQYLSLNESGQDNISAFEEAFGTTVEGLNKQVKDYIYRQRQFEYFQMPPEKLLPVFNPSVVKLSRQEAALELGKLALRAGELDRAEELYSIATESESTRPQAEAGLGDVLKFSGEFDAAEPHFETAIRLAPDDPYCQLDMAEYWHSRAFNSEDADERDEFLEQARSYYVKAWQLDDSMPEIYAMYGQTFLQAGERTDRAIELLEEAEFLLPSNLDIRISLGEAYTRAGQNDDAIKLARSVLAWSHAESSLTKRAEEILEALGAANRAEGDVEEIEGAPN
jgi:tetratricopeptide (TPR) repeat protein